MKGLVEFNRRFRITKDDDGDFHFVIITPQKTHSLEVCCNHGGVGNREIYKAIENLAAAIEEHGFEVGVENK